MTDCDVLLIYCEMVQAGGNIYRGLFFLAIDIIILNGYNIVRILLLDYEEVSL